METMMPLGRCKRMDQELDVRVVCTYAAIET